MNDFSERRLAENELMFRHINTKNKGRQLREDISEDDSLVIDCYCECSNRQCHARIRIDNEQYDEIHKDNKQFIALPNHENKAIEQVVRQLDGFNVVQKYADPSEVAKTPTA